MKFDTAISSSYKKGQDCTKQFRKAYLNRYTWDEGFDGYKGICQWSNGEKTLNGIFELGKDLKPHIEGINNEDISKAIYSQLWEVSIHRVRRSFNSIHGENQFYFGDINESGIEVIVNGKNKGDSYRIKDNIITMVNRNMHGMLIKIYTLSTIDTGFGYLSSRYTSEYRNTQSGEIINPKNIFEDNFTPLFDGGPWVLTKRVVKTANKSLSANHNQTFTFLDLKKIE